MSDDAEEIEDGEGEAKSKPSIMKLGLFIGLPVLILLLGGVGAFMFLSGGGEEEVVAEHVDEHGEGHDGEGDHGDGHGSGEAHHEELYYYEISQESGHPIIVNIRGSDGRPLLMQLELSLEITDPHLVEVLDAQMPVVIDQMTTFLRELREDDLYGSAGNHRLKLELLRRVNLAIAPNEVNQVLILRFLISD